MDFESANPLNTWLRLYSREQKLPRIDAYLADELPDLVYYTVDTAELPLRRTIQSNGTRMSNVFGQTGKGKSLDQYLGARLAPVVMPVYTIANIDDIYGRIFACERLLLPFRDGGDITHVIASLKTISDDGGFEIKNLMRGNDALPTPKLRTVIDRDLFNRAAGRIPFGDLIEFG